MSKDIINIKPQPEDLNRIVIEEIRTQKITLKLIRKKHYDTESKLGSIESVSEDPTWISS